MTKRKKITFDPDYQRTEKMVGGYLFKEAAGREAIRRVNMGNSVTKYAEEHPEDLEGIQILALYPHLAGCAWPVMTIDQFLEIPEKLLDEMSHAAMELNPHWFPSLESEKKTEETREKSLEKSETLLTP